MSLNTRALLPKISIYLIWYQILLIPEAPVLPDIPQVGEGSTFETLLRRYFERAGGEYGRLVPADARPVECETPPVAAYVIAPAKMNRFAV